MSNTSLELRKKTTNTFAIVDIKYLYELHRKMEITLASRNIQCLYIKHCVLRLWSCEKNWFAIKFSAIVNHKWAL